MVVGQAQKKSAAYLLPILRYWHSKSEGKSIKFDLWPHNSKLVSRSAKRIADSESGHFFTSIGTIFNPEIERKKIETSPFCPVQVTGQNFKKNKKTYRIMMFAFLMQKTSSKSVQPFSQSIRNQFRWTDKQTDTQTDKQTDPGTQQFWNPTFLKIFAPLASLAPLG